MNSYELLVARDLIIIGTGDYYTHLVAPAVVSLRKQGLISSVITVDLEVKERPLGVKHVVRQPGQAITELVDQLGLDEPIIILSHANELHATEAYELLGASSKPRILIEKPYAIHQKDLTTLRDVLDHSGDRVGLLEYYLLMKGIPLLAFGGVIKQDSFFFEDNGILKSSRGDIREYVGKMGIFIRNFA